MKMPNPVEDNVHNRGGSASEQTLPLADNAPAISGDQGMHIPSAPTTHINEMPCNKVTITPGPKSVTDGQMKGDPTQIKAIDVSATTGSTQTADVPVNGYRELTVVWRLLATTTPGDLTLNDAIAYVDDPTGTDVLVDVPLASTTAVAPTATASDVVAVKVYRVAGLKTVRVRGKNNNAGSKTMKVYALLSPQTPSVRAW